MKASRVIGTGTFGCGSTIVEGEDFIAENITFENSAPEVRISLHFIICVVFFLNVSIEQLSYYKEVQLFII